MTDKHKLVRCVFRFTRETCKLCSKNKPSHSRRSILTQSKVNQREHSSGVPVTQSRRRWMSSVGAPHAHPPHASIFHPHTSATGPRGGKSKRKAEGVSQIMVWFSKRNCCTRGELSRLCRHSHINHSVLTDGWV